MNVETRREMAGMITSAKSLAHRFAADDTGATAIEYSLLASLIAIACITAFRQLGTTNSGVWFQVSTTIIAAMK